jgi:hypothetical protein
VQIALAIAIVRSKPENITAVQHAATIQARFRAKYPNCVSFVTQEFTVNWYNKTG